ncbi:hypothetical protein M9H77_31967 [Catharanthus roseus]|uniref:Uncharacterized protein n=1 Tax=Catharanthus roseus TaxID=4058 RepID=A0ACC0A2L8_CATRO|nr:hypothetical protein M9H77_31967 [Catharanthus roseus]
MSILHLVANDPKIPISNIIQEVQDINPGTVYEFLHHRTSSPPNYESSKSWNWFLKNLREYVVKDRHAGTETKQWKFDRVMKKIQKRNVDAYIYLMKLDAEKWTLLHDGGHRHGIMTTNISKALNSMLKKARVLPLKALFLRIEMKSREHKVTTYNPREGIYMVRSPIGFLVCATTSIHCS